MTPTKTNRPIKGVPASGHWTAKPGNAVYLRRGSLQARKAAKGPNPFIGDISFKSEADLVDRDLLESKIAESEIRTENRIVKLESSITSSLKDMAHEIGKLSHSIDEIRRNSLSPTQALAGAFTLFIGIVGAMIGILSYGGDRGDAGYGLGAAVENRVSATEKKFEELSSDMEEIKQLIKGMQQPHPVPSEKSSD